MASSNTTPKKSLEMEQYYKTGDSRSLDLFKVIGTIWTIAFQPNKQQQVFDLVKIIQSALADSNTLDDVEFYLPQIAHLIIHLDATHIQALEYLAICLCQNSTHTALQLYFIVSAAIEDYQLENDHGVRNPNTDPHRYFRCCHLLNCILRTVVFGTLAITAEDERRLLTQQADLSQVYVEQRQARAEHLIKEPNDFSDISTHAKKAGELYFKRKYRKSVLASKHWKPRFVRVYDRVLYCFHDDAAPSPLRAMMLVGCKLALNTSVHHNFVFTLLNDITGVEMSFMAPTQEVYDDWIQFLQNEIERAPDMIPDSHGNVSEQLYDTQRKRLQQFIGEINFVSNLTSICEYLRFVDVDSRKAILRDRMSKLDVPPYAYLPLCSSLSPYSGILRVVPPEAHAFTTKARVPAMMIFEVEVHPEHRDAATFLGAELHEYSESRTLSPNSVSGRSDSPPAGSSSSNALARGTSNASDGSVESKFEHVSATSLKSRMGWKERQISETVDANDGPSTPRAGASEATAGATVPRGVISGSESFKDKAARVRAESPFKELAGWKLDGLIAKSNDDVRQEVFVMQLITFFQKIFRDEVPDLWLHTYKIVSCSQRTGLIQLITDAISYDGLKKSSGYPGSLRAHFEANFGPPGSPELKAAVLEFVKSMAAYSLVTFLLAIKDRHNGNVMLDSRGHCIHIDFGFVFGLAPGKQFSMEKAPFKLTEEYVDVMGGRTSPEFTLFSRLLRKGFLCARKHADEMISMMEIMMFESNYPCFKYNPHAIRDFKNRLQLHDRSNEESHWEPYVDRLIDRSYKSVGTGLYDQFQLATNGIVV